MTNPTDPTFYWWEATGVNHQVARSIFGMILQPGAQLVILRIFCGLWPLIILCILWSIALWKWMVWLEQQHYVMLFFWLETGCDGLHVYFQCNSQHPFLFVKFPLCSQFSNGLAMFQILGGRAMTSLKFTHPKKWGNTNTLNSNVILWLEINNWCVCNILIDVKLSLPFLPSVLSLFNNAGGWGSLGVPHLRKRPHQVDVISVPGQHWRTCTFIFFTLLVYMSKTPVIFTDVLFILLMLLVYMSMTPVVYTDVARG